MPKRIRIFGRVQGVFFRMNTVLIARKLGINGWVRNLDDGSVEVLAEGKRMEEFIEFLKRGPPAARVDKIKIKESKEKVSKGFFRR